MGDTVVVRMPRLDLDKLSTRQKLTLIERIWESLDKKGLPQLTQAEGDELDRRLAEYDSGKVRAVPWREAKEQIRRRLRRRSR
jgi:putative addiction module component (TIGR02574 family)